MPIKIEKLPELAGAGAGAGAGAAVGSIPPLSAPIIRAPRGPTKRRPTPEEIEAGFEGLDLPEEDRIPKKKRKKKKKPVKKNMGGMMRYGHGGKVRGAGKAVKGVRPAKMVKMKGS
jgi:hypothetical protein